LRHDDVTNLWPRQQAQVGVGQQGSYAGGGQQLFQVAREGCAGSVAFAEVEKRVAACMGGGEDNLVVPILWPQVTSAKRDYSLHAISNSETVEPYVDGAECAVGGQGRDDGSAVICAWRMVLELESLQVVGKTASFGALAGKARGYGDGVDVRGIAGMNAQRRCEIGVRHLVDHIGNPHRKDDDNCE